MVIFRRLWQRVFVYSFLLVLAAGAAGVFLLKKNLVDEASGVVVSFTGELRRALTGLDAGRAASLLERFNSQEAKFWLEDGQGNLVAGERFAGRAGKDWAGHLRSPSLVGEVQLWRTDLKQPLFLAVVPCALRDQSASLYGAFMPFPTPPLATLLSPGIITLSLIAGLLALWIALRVGKPLRLLREEVALDSGSPAQLNHVTVSGSDEVADVAGAINRLVDNLRNHIDGMNQLVVNVSHELRSPLTRMGISAEMIEAGLAAAARGEQALAGEERAAVRLAASNLEALRRELEYMDQLIGDTLFAGKLSVQKPEDLTEAVSLSALCASAAERFGPAFGQAGVRFIRSVEPGLEVTGDAVLLTQVISNLLDNARKYARAGDAREDSTDQPRVWLRLVRQNGSACLSVENTHPPLPPEAMPHLFEPYYRHEQPIGSGAGLGLAIVQKIAALHGGEVGVENSDRGVLFRVSLPLRR